MHRDLELSAGLTLMGGPWPNRLLMGAGFGSPGNLALVLRGSTGDRSAPRRNADDGTVQACPLPPIQGSFVSLAGGQGLTMPLEWGPLRLRTMGEGMAHGRPYVHADTVLTQRGGPFLLDADDSLLVGDKDRGILGFSATMARPLSCLDPSLAPASPALNPDPERVPSSAFPLRTKALEIRSTRELEAPIGPMAVDPINHRLEQGPGGGGI
jgi:hypothetical protein